MKTKIILVAILSLIIPFALLGKTKISVDGLYIGQNFVKACGILKNERSEFFGKYNAYDDMPYGTGDATLDDLLSKKGIKGQKICWVNDSLLVSKSGKVVIIKKRKKGNSFKGSIKKGRSLMEKFAKKYKIKDFVEYIEKEGSGVKYGARSKKSKVIIYFGKDFPEMNYGYLQGNAVILY